MMLARRRKIRSDHVGTWSFLLVILSAIPTPASFSDSPLASLDIETSRRWVEKRDQVLSWEMGDRLSDEEVGITEYVTKKNKGTGGILKSRWSDFRVQELRARDREPVVLSHTRAPRSRREDGPRFLRFVMAKAGYDTISAVSRLASWLRIPRQAFSYAGVKDKSAVTSQEVTLDGKGLNMTSAAAKLLSVSSWLPRVKVGSMEWCDAALRPGESAGNRFTLLLRHLSTKRESRVVRCVRRVQRRGFINYYGHQRLGLGMRSSMPTINVGKALLQCKWEAAVGCVMSTEHATDEQERRAKALFQRGWVQWLRSSRADASARREALQRLAATCLPLLPGHCYGEISLISALKDGASLQQALRAMPHRTMYMLGYWSWLWNVCASERVRRFGAKRCVPGDLVCADMGEAASALQRDWPLTVHVVTAQEAEDKVFSPFDIVLPVLGRSVLVSLPDNELAQHMASLVDAQGMRSVVDGPPSLLSSRQPCLFRPLLVKPHNLTHQVLHYHSDADIEVVQDDAFGHYAARGRGGRSAAAEAEEEEEQQAEKLALQLSFVLPPAAFATSLVREVTRESVHPSRHCQLRQESEAEAGRKRAAQRGAGRKQASKAKR